MSWKIHEALLHKDRLRLKPLKMLHHILKHPSKFRPAASLSCARPLTHCFHSYVRARNWGGWGGTPPHANLVPIVIEQTVSSVLLFGLELEIRSLHFLAFAFVQGRGERSYDIFSRLLRERVIMLYGPVRSLSCSLMWMLFKWQIDQGHRCSTDCRSVALS